MAEEQMEALAFQPDHFSLPTYENWAFVIGVFMDSLLRHAESRQKSLTIFSAASTNMF